MFVCLKCWDVYRGLVEDQKIKDFNGGFCHCPKVNCGGYVREIDELIAPTIIELNKKHYLTKYCCSGHWYENCFSPYIYFKEGYVPDTVPKSFYLDNSGLTIRCKRDAYDFEDDVEKFQYVLSINNELFEWAKDLPSLYA